MLKEVYQGADSPLRMSRMQDVRKITVWGSVSILGISLMAVGLAAFAIDFMTRGHYSQYLGDNYELLFGIILAGLISLIVGFVGLASNLGRRGRASLGIKVLFLPIVVCVLAGILGGTNVHGTYFIFVLAMLPISLLGLILLVVAGFTAKD
jgi:hypothetical protein